MPLSAVKAQGGFLLFMHSHSGGPFKNCTWGTEIGYKNCTWGTVSGVKIYV